ncbi:MAG: tetratricopeptide repeat protein, partial [Vicinamibacterales bacterium]
LTLSAAGCAQLAQLQAMKAFKAANAAYQQQDYKKAAGLYEEALEANPDLVQAYFFLGNSYDQQYRPGRKGEPANDELLTKAVDYYQKAANALGNSEVAEEKKVGKLALEYLVAAYGADKLNDPAAAEPVVQRMIQLEPGETSNYFALAKIYEDAGVYDEAERMLLAAREARPNDPTVYMQMAGYYNRQADFDKTIDALTQRTKVEPTNPEAFFTISTYYWDNAQRNALLSDADKRVQVEKGLEAVNKALEIKSDYMEALVYKGLLLRVQATLEKEYPKQQALIKEANELRDQAEEIKKKRQTGD